MHVLRKGPAPSRPPVYAARGSVTGLQPFELAGWLQVSKQLAVGRDKEIYQIVYDRLTLIAASMGARWFGENTPRGASPIHQFLLEATAAENISVDDRRHFFALAASMMRQIFIDSARRKLVGDPGTHFANANTDDTLVVDVRCPQRLLVVDQLVDKLLVEKPDAASAFVYRHFARLNVPEIAEVMGITEATVQCHLKFANVYIMHHMLDQG